MPTVRTIKSSRIGSLRVKRVFSVWTVSDSRDTCGHQHDTLDAAINCADTRATSRPKIEQRVDRREKTGESVAEYYCESSPSYKG